ncbi:MAG: cache domain-containing protein, partial [Thermosynechococcaceae cyanobacterium]
LSLQYGHEAIEKVSTQYREELADRIGDQLTHRMAVPLQLNQLNIASSTLGLLDWADRTQLGRLFWQQMKIYPQVGYINYADETRNFIGVERLDSGTLMVHKSLDHQPSHILKYQSDAAGRVLSPQISYEPESVREEGWYADAVKARKPVWSSIYPWQDKPDVLSISASVPIYSPSHQLQGVVGVDLILTQLSHFLRNLPMTPGAKAFLVEPNGLLVASSTPESLLQRIEGRRVRKAALAIQDPLIRATAQSIQQHFGDFASIATPQPLEFRFDGQDQYVQITPWRDRFGLSWLVVVTIPETDLMAELQESNQYVLLVLVAALGIAIVSGLLTSRVIAQTVKRLGKASQAIAEGQLDQSVPSSKIMELSDLSDAFNRMAEQVCNGFTHLESRVQERTLSLQQTEEKYRSIFENASDGIYQTTPDGKYQNANLALAKIYGYDSPIDLMAHISCIAEQLYVNSTDRHTFIQEIAIHGQIMEFEAQVYCKNGKKIWISENARAVKDAQGQLLYYLGGRHHSL